MITEDQTAVIEFLASPATHGGASVDRIDTHSSAVFLAGSRAYKLKRAVLFDYLDFSTRERRHALCDLEARLNRRTAPMLYRRVVAVTREPDGALALGGSGSPIDWLVEMNRFAQEDLFDRRARDGRLDLELMNPLGAAIAAFHAGAERRSDHGGKAAVAWVIDGNAAGFHEFGGGWLDAATAARVTAAARLELDRRGPLLDTRRHEYVRQCHGDLHLRNIVLLDGRPVLFDGVEFNEEISCIDVLYDLAFLIMDLWRRQLPAHANAVWNGYMRETGDLGGVALMPLFLACRAAVRAKTSATAASLLPADSRKVEAQSQSGEYLAMAEALLDPAQPCLIAVGGLSGSGKSTLAQALAPAVGGAPGALVLRSDEIRKQLCGAAPLERLGSGGYTAAVSARVYEALAERAVLALRGGQSTIVDAVYRRPSDRQALAQVAAQASAPFVGLWLDAPESTLIGRVERRPLDASDAGPDVVRQQLARHDDPDDWYRLDASPSAAVVLRAALTLLQRRVGWALRFRHSV